MVVEQWFDSGGGSAVGQWWRWRWSGGLVAGVVVGQLWGWSWLVDTGMGVWLKPTFQ